MRKILNVIPLLMLPCMASDYHHSHARAMLFAQAAAIPHVKQHRHGDGKPDLTDWVESPKPTMLADVLGEGLHTQDHEGNELPLPLVVSRSYRPEREED